MPGALRDLVLLLLMCLALYCTGLDTHGVTNWQEAQRVVVAREMQQRIAAGDAAAWYVPRHNGLAYIAKPPVIYWVTVALAEARGAEVRLFDLRLAVALAGTLGVLGTYMVARGVLRPVRVKWGGPEDGRHIAGARWAAVFLATGVLYFRSSRIGELDILLVPSVVGAIGCIWVAWRFYIEKREEPPAQTGLGAAILRRMGLRAHWLAVIGAALLATVAALTKGPPALMVIALAGYGGIVLWALHSESPDSTGHRWEGWAILTRVWVTLFAAIFAVIGAWRATGFGDLPGIAIMAFIGAGAGWMTSRLRQVEIAGDLLWPKPAGSSARRSLVTAHTHGYRRLWLAMAHTHPVLVLGIPVLVFWGWGQAVSAEIGADLAMDLAREQADNDLNLFTPASPVKNLEALAYGCGVGSILMLAAAAWWVKYRPALRAGAAGVMIPVAWVLLSFCALSLFGKGVARYLTPVWPGVAIIAGAWVARNPRREPGEAARGAAPDPRGWVVLAAVCATLGIGQAWWYAHGREVFEHERSPRAIMREMTLPAKHPTRFGSFEFYTPALDYYAGAYVHPIVNAQMGVAVAGGAPWTLEELVADVRANGPMVVLCREWSLDRSLPTPIERMQAAGLNVDPIGLSDAAVFRIDNKRAVVRAVRVW